MRTRVTIALTGNDRLHIGRQLSRCHIPNIGLTVVQRIDLALVQINAHHLIAGFSKIHRQWQANIAQPDDGNLRTACLKL